MADPITISLISVGISLFSFVVSAIVAWQTLFCRGSLGLTKPTLIVFTHEKLLTPVRKTIPKIFLRTLLYSTAKRGWVIENMFVNLRHENAEYPFHVWFYGDSNFMRGSGVFVAETGVAVNHHFTPHIDVSKFEFSEGEYQLEVFATTVNLPKPRRLCSVTLSVPQEAAIGLLKEADCDYWFDWDPTEHRYQGHLERRS
jgi:hypothetical protein